MESKYTLEEYKASNGKIPFREWLNSLKDFTAKAAVRTRLNRVQYLGAFGDHKPVGDGVLEMRIDFGPGYRVYYAFHGKHVVLLLAGGAKGSQNRDIEKAKNIWLILGIVRTDDNPAI